MGDCHGYVWTAVFFCLFVFSSPSSSFEAGSACKRLLWSLFDIGFSVVRERVYIIPYSFHIPISCKG